MDLSDPWSLFSGLLIGAIGMAIFLYGKKQANVMCLAAGALLCALPYLVSSVIVDWAVTGVCLAALYAASRNG